MSERRKRSSIIRKKTPSHSALEKNVNFNPEEETVVVPSSHETFTGEVDEDEEYYDYGYRFSSFDDNDRKHLNKCQQCGRYIYNKEDESCCGRTCSSWFKILFYYLSFFAVVIGMLLAFVYSSQQKYDTGRPGIAKYNFISDASPGVSIFPSIYADRPYTIVWYTFKGKDTADNRRAGSYIQLIKKLFAEQAANCKKTENDTIPCKFNKTDFGPCGEPDYGYTNKTPCLYLKLNKLEKWYPETYSSSAEYPSHMSDELKEIYNSSRACLYVNCQGKHDFDEDYLGEIKYYPEQAFHERYFPSKKFEHINPIIAVHLENMKAGYIINIECHLYAKNVNYINEKAQTVVYVGSV